MRPTCLCEILCVYYNCIFPLDYIAYGEEQQEIGRSTERPRRCEKLYLMELRRGKLRINPLEG